MCFQYEIKWVVVFNFLNFFFHPKILQVEELSRLSNTTLKYDQTNADEPA